MMMDDCHSIAASTDEILWSDDETIVADMEEVWNQGILNIISYSIKTQKQLLVLLTIFNC